MSPPQLCSCEISESGNTGLWAGSGLRRTRPGGLCCLSYKSKYRFQLVAFTGDPEQKISPRAQNPFSTLWDTPDANSWKEGIGGRALSDEGAKAESPLGYPRTLEAAGCGCAGARVRG